MRCPVCSYVLTDFDTECPRCARMPKVARPGPQATTPPPWQGPTVFGAPMAPPGPSVQQSAPISLTVNANFAQFNWQKLATRIFYFLVVWAVAYYGYSYFCSNSAENSVRDEMNRVAATHNYSVTCVSVTMVNESGHDYVGVANMSDGTTVNVTMVNDGSGQIVFHYAIPDAWTQQAVQKAISSPPEGGSPIPSNAISTASAPTTNGSPPSECTDDANYIVEYNKWNDEIEAAMAEWNKSHDNPANVAEKQASVETFISRIDSIQSERLSYLNIPASFSFADSQFANSLSALDSAMRKMDLQYQLGTDDKTDEIKQELGSSETLVNSSWDEFYKTKKTLRAQCGWS